jgi:hypothetical protein
LDLGICTYLTKLCFPNRCEDFKLILTPLLANVLRQDIIPTLTYLTPLRAEVQAMLSKAYPSLLNLFIRVVAGKLVMDSLLISGKTTG